MNRSDKTIYFIATAAGCKVDREKGIIFGVAVITGGVKAKGHDLWTDDVTLLQMKEQGASRGKVLVKENHKNAGGGTTGVDAMAGYLTNFHVADGKTKADLHLYPSHPRRDLYLDAAENTPELFGLSAAFVPPEKEERKGGKKMARVEELVSVDLVTTPAANPSGLFSAEVDSSAGAMNDDSTSGAKDPILAAIQQLTGQFETFKQTVEARLTNIEAASQPELTIGDLAEMTDEQLAEHGLTREQAEAMIEQAIAEAQAAGDEQLKNAAGEAAEGEGTGEAGAAEGEGAAAPAAAGASLSAALKRITELEASNAALIKRFAAEDDAAQREAVNTEFSAIEEALETLSAENEALRTAYAAKGTKAVQHGRDLIGFEVGDKPEGSFERIVEMGVKSGKKRSLAMLEAIRSNPAAHAEYRRRLGVEKKR